MPFLSRVSAAAALTALMMSPALGGNEQQTAGAGASFVPALPAPRGSYAVGTSVLVFTDSTRSDPSTPESDDKRTIVVQLWYPATPATTGRPAPYMPELETLKEAFRSGTDALRRIESHALLDVPMAATAKSPPVILFSHGMGNPRAFYTTLLSDWASHGVLVAAIDHPGMGLVALPGGRLIRPYDPWTKAPPGLRERSEAERDAHWAPGRTMISADQRFVAEQLDQLNRTDRTLGLQGRVSSRMIHVGHSDGFLSQTCVSDSRVVGCVNLDGVPAMAERQAGMRTPYLAIRDGNDAPVIEDIYAVMKSPAFDMVIKESNHNASTDLGLFAAASVPAATQQLRAISDAVMAFTTLTLTGGDQREFVARIEQIPGVQLRVYGSGQRD